VSFLLGFLLTFFILMIEGLVIAAVANALYARRFLSERAIERRAYEDQKAAWDEYVALLESAQAEAKEKALRAELEQQS
jgi:hypothetical protein